MPTLYRDYRPNNFSEVFGQNHIKITLQNEIANQKLAQAYLFCGPRAVGKTTLARILAKAVNCTGRKASDSEPCNKCASCLSISNGSNFDVVEIDAASNTGVDNVRENIIASARVASSSSKFRVFIIDEVHMLSISAWNALLKTLEEPPKNVIFILCTTEIHKVPATIVSRCERYDFKRISVADIVNKLQNIVSQEKVDIEHEVLEAIARQSDGHLRDAESLLGQVLSLGEKKITWDQAELIVPKYHHNEIIDLLEFISKKDASQAIKLINNIVDSGLNLKGFVGEGVVVLRKILLNKVNPGLAQNLGLDLGDSLEIRISSLADKLEINQIVLYLEAFLKVYNNSTPSFIVQLPLEIKVIELCLDSNKVNSNVINNHELLNKKESPVAKIADNQKPNISQVDSINIKMAAVAPDQSEAEVSAKWPEFLIKLRSANYSLSFILQNCQAGALSGGKMPIIFKYKFHHDRINDPNIKLTVENTLAEIFGGLVKLDLLVNENLELNTVSAESLAPSSASAESISNTNNNNNNNNTTTKKDDSSNLLNNLLQTFGGEVIN